MPITVAVVVVIKAIKTESDNRQRPLAQSMTIKRTESIHATIT